MPNYEYECNHCDHSFVEFQTMSEDRLVKCPACKKNKLERLISGGAGILFKGSGFYETDYKKKKNEPANGTEDSSKKKVESSTVGKSKDTEKVKAPAEKKASSEVSDK